MLALKPILRPWKAKFFGNLIHSCRLARTITGPVGGLLWISFLLLVPGRGEVAHQAAQPPPQASKNPTPKQMAEPETLPIATVGGVEISLDKFNELYLARASRVRTSDGKIPQSRALGIKSALVNLLIEEQLIEQEAKRRGVTLTAGDIDNALRQLASTFPNSEAFQNYLANVGGGEQALRDTLRIKVLKERLAGVNPNEPVTDEEASAYYQQHHARFNVPAHLTVQDIFFPVGADAKSDFGDAQKAKAEAALEQARKPNVSFGSLARQQSQGPRAKAGGDLGLVTQQSIDPVLWNELLKLEPGQISGVIKAADGYHILKLVRRNPEVRQSFEQAKDEIKTTIRARRRSAKVSELVVTLRKKTKIENHFLRRYPQAAPGHIPARSGRALEGGILSPGSPPAILPPGPGAKATKRIP